MIPVVPHSRTRWSFRPPAWTVFGTAIGCALMAGLGFWQVWRGEQKQMLLDQYRTARQAQPMTLDVRTSAPIGATTVAAQAHGHYLADRQLLLDGQSHGSDVGFDVWTPLRLDDGGLLIVNRGWIPSGKTRDDLPDPPAPTDEQNLTGFWRRLPQPGLRLGAGACAQSASTSTSNAIQPPVPAATTPTPKPALNPATRPRLAEYPSAADLQCIYGEPVLAGELLLAPDAEGGFTRDWAAAPAEFPPMRHYGYAAQWFAFAATLLGIFIKLNLKRIS